MKSDPVSVEIIKNCEAELIPFSVIRLGTFGAATINE